MCGPSMQFPTGLHQRATIHSPKGAADAAAGPVRRFISLSDSGYLAKFCCWVPGIILFGMIALVSMAALLSTSAFYAITVALTVFSYSYSTNLSLSCVFGAWQMRRSCREDWDEKLRKLQGEDSAMSVMHLVILPNYKEDENMLQDTLENLGRSAIARDSMRVVLAMEAREGPRGQQKAERLIANTRHLFADIISSYHPANLPGEVAGKSSNTQWAYRAALQRWGTDLLRVDASRVLLTVGDADTLWHPQFFSALAFEALSLPEAERVWSIWQPPVLLLRNLFSVPGPTRVSCYATILFELAGLANQCFGTHFCYSAYSLSLALTSHPLVGGWDRDVIAEDHHMFCKCYFAAIREAVEVSNKNDSVVSPVPQAVVAKVQLRPVYLPAMSFLVESGDGWLASVYARFQQARRHSQGIAELSYVLLQYIHLLLETGFSRLPARTHASVFSIVGKMATVHIINQVQALALVFAMLLLVPGAISWILSGGISSTLEIAATLGYCNAIHSAVGGLGGLLKYVLAIFGPIPPMGVLMTYTTCIVVADALEGRLTQGPQKKDQISRGKDKSAVCLENASSMLDIGSTAASFATGFKGRLSLFFQIQNDYFSMAHFTLLAYGLLPVCLAAWSLLRNGQQFEYIVAAKPS